MQRVAADAGRETVQRCSPDPVCLPDCSNASATLMAQADTLNAEV